jgi:hypothetical protein
VREVKRIVRLVIQVESYVLGTREMGINPSFVCPESAVFVGRELVFDADKKNALTVDYLESVVL